MNARILSLLASLALLGIPSAALAEGQMGTDFIRHHYPPSIQPLLIRESRLQGECSDRETARTGAICRQRDGAVAAIERQGWCWGPNDGSGYEADKIWMRAGPRCQLSR